MGERKTFLKKLLTSRLVLILLLILALIFLISSFKAFWRDYQIRKEIRALEQEKGRWEKDKLSLLNRLNDIKSRDFIEKEARLNFGLAKPGESLVIITEPVKSTPTAEKTSADQPPSSSNAKNWWRYFFK